MKCGLERFSKRRHHLLDSVGFLGPEDAIVFASATEARSEVDKSLPLPGNFRETPAQCKTPVVFWLKIWERCFGPSGQVCV